jgi:hypothetical protein
VDFGVLNDNLIKGLILCIVKCLSLIVCESLQGEVGIVLESPDQKTRGFMVLIALPW